MFHYMNEKEVTFNVKYEIVLYAPDFNAWWGGGGGGALLEFILRTFLLNRGGTCQV